MFWAALGPCTPTQAGHSELCPSLPGVLAEQQEEGPPHHHGFPASPLALIS